MSAYMKSVLPHVRTQWRQPRICEAVLAAGILAVGLALSMAPVHAQGLTLETTEPITGLVRPLGIADPGDGTGRLFIVQQSGEIRIWNGTSLESAVFLDLSSRVTTGGEAGLLGLVFHPAYAANGEFFVNYTRTESGQLQTVVARFTVSDTDPNLADPESEEILLVIDQPAGNHNAGDLAFGPDGYLYVPMGDGGGAGDPNENGQDLSTPLGKILRIDIDSTPGPGLAYAIPPDNPFKDQAGVAGEIWAYGLRNPFRISFDRDRGDLWIADVGQSAWEELNLQPAESGGGENYGWDCREGAHDYIGPDNDNFLGCAGLSFVDPVVEYAHDNGRCSVTGGYRYRGDDYPQLRGVYLFADFCTGEIFGTVPSCDSGWESRRLVGAPFNITAFGEDSAGEVYVTERVNTDSASSKIHKLALADASHGPDLELSPSPVDFGNIEAGDTVTLILTVENDNPGPEAALVTGHSLSDPTRFSVDYTKGSAPCGNTSRNTNQATSEICQSPGQSCTMAVSLKAEFSGVVSETLTFDGNFESEVINLEANVLPCSTDQNLVVSDLTVVDGVSETRRACDTLTVGPNVTVQSGGELSLQAGTSIVLTSEFRVEQGGKLSVDIF